MQKLWEGLLGQVDDGIEEYYDQVMGGENEATVVLKCVEEDENSAIAHYPYFVKVPQLGVILREGICFVKADTDAGWEPDFNLTLVYDDADSSAYVYWEQDDFVISLANLCHDKHNIGEISLMQCELWTD